MFKVYDRKKFSRLPDAILFDIDNTLYPYNPAHLSAQRAVKQKAIESFSISSDTFDEEFQKSRTQIKKRLKGMASSHSRLLYLQKMMENLGLGSQIFLSLDFEQTYWSTFLNNAVLFEGVEEILDDLRLLSIPTAIVTDLTSQIQFRKLVFFGLDQSFDYVVTSEESGADKPNEIPFNIALDKIRPSGKNIWMIGDNPISDIRGAREAINAVTLQKIHTGNPVGTGDGKPDLAFNDFTRLSTFVSNIEDE